MAVALAHAGSGGAWGAGLATRALAVLGMRVGGAGSETAAARRLFGKCWRKRWLQTRLEVASSCQRLHTCDRVSVQAGVRLCWCTCTWAMMVFIAWDACMALRCMRVHMAKGTVQATRVRPGVQGPTWRALGIK